MKSTINYDAMLRQRAARVAAESKFAHSARPAVTEKLSGEDLRSRIEATLHEYGPCTADEVMFAWEMEGDVDAPLGNRVPQALVEMEFTYSTVIKTGEKRPTRLGRKAAVYMLYFTAKPRQPARPVTNKSVV